MKISWLGLVSCLILACGTHNNSYDSSEQSEATEKDKQESDGKTDSERSLDSKESLNPETKDDPDNKEDYVESGLSATGEFSIDSVYISYRDSYIYKIRIGSVVWDNQVIASMLNDVENTCYDNEYSNCVDYGRLYSAKGNMARNACLNGTNLASSKDWEALEAYRSEHKEIDRALSLRYGGYCEKSADTLKCSGIGEIGNYLTSDGKIISIQKGKEKFSINKPKEKGLYNILCVGYPAFVKTKKDLPTCDTNLINPPKQIYVFEEKENYSCYSEQKTWLPDFTETCTEEIKTFVYNDTMMICDDEIWQLASIDDYPNICIREDQGKILMFNGLKYACDSSEWRRFTPLEDTIGICNDRKSGTFDTLYSGTNFELYYCDSSSWKKATILDYKGPCEDSTSKFMNDTIDFKNTRYVCRGNGWVEYTALEKRFGVCVPSKLFMFENGSYDVNDETTQYICDTTGWEKIYSDVIIGQCDSTGSVEIAEYRGDHMYCASNGNWYFYRERTYWHDVFDTCKNFPSGHILSGDYHNTYLCKLWPNSDTMTVTITSFPECSKENEKGEYTWDDVTYYCNGDGYWHNFYDDIKYCTITNWGEIIESKYGLIGCDNSGWRTVSEEEAVLGLCSFKTSLKIAKNKEQKYICLNNGWLRYRDKSTFRIKGIKEEDEK